MLPGAGSVLCSASRQGAAAGSITNRQACARAARQACREKPVMGSAQRITQVRRGGLVGAVWRAEGSRLRRQLSLDPLRRKYVPCGRGGPRTTKKSPKLCVRAWEPSGRTMVPCRPAYFVEIAPSARRWPSIGFRWRRRRFVGPSKLEKLISSAACACRWCGTPSCPQMARLGRRLAALRD